MQNASTPSSPLVEAAEGNNLALHSGEGVLQRGRMVKTQSSLTSFVWSYVAIDAPHRLLAFCVSKALGCRKRSKTSQKHLQKP